MCLAAAQVAEARRQQLLAAHQRVLDQDFFMRSAANSAVGDISTAGGLAASASADGGLARSLDGSFLSYAGSSAAGGGQGAAAPPPAGHSAEFVAQLRRLRDAGDGSRCRAADLLLPELGVTTAEAKSVQAELHSRRVWELKAE
jgi:hypothetical protein